MLRAVMGNCTPRVSGSFPREWQGSKHARKGIEGRLVWCGGGVMCSKPLASSSLGPVHAAGVAALLVMLGHSCIRGRGCGRTGGRSTCAHMHMCSHAHVLTCSCAHMLMCSHAHVLTCTGRVYLRSLPLSGIACLVQRATLQGVWLRQCRVTRRGAVIDSDTDTPVRELSMQGVL